MAHQRPACRMVQGLPGSRAVAAAALGQHLRGPALHAWFPSPVSVVSWDWLSGSQEPLVDLSPQVHSQGHPAVA